MTRILNVSKSAVPVTTIVIEAGQAIFVSKILPHKIERLAEVEHCVSDDMRRRSTRLTFKQDSILSVVGLTDNLMTCGHLLFARYDIRKWNSEARLAFGSTPITWSRLARSIRRSQDTTFVPYGFDAVRTYPDEIAVYDEPEGSRGWIIQRSEIERYLAREPKIAPPARLEPPVPLARTIDREFVSPASLRTLKRAA
jgi:hypothetical protein